MPRQKPTDKIDVLKRKREQIDAQLRALETRNKEAERKADTRRKVITGALALEHLEKNRESAFSSIMTKLLDEYVTRPADRALFPFLPETVGQTMKAAAVETLKENAE